MNYVIEGSTQISFGQRDCDNEIEIITYDSYTDCEKAVWLDQQKIKDLIAFLQAQVLQSNE